MDRRHLVHKPPGLTDPGSIAGRSQVGAGEAQQGQVLRNPQLSKSRRSAVLGHWPVDVTHGSCTHWRPQWRIASTGKRQPASAAPPINNYPNSPDTGFGEAKGCSGCIIGHAEDTPDGRFGSMMNTCRAIQFGPTQLRRICRVGCRVFAASPPMRPSRVGPLKGDSFGPLLSRC